MKKDGKQKDIKKRYSKWIVAVIVVAILGSGVAIYASVAGNSTVPTSLALTTITLSKTEISNTISVSGQVDSSSVVNIYSSLSNYPVSEVLTKIGESVKKGDVLARIDTTDLKYDITQAENNLESAKKSLETEKQNNQNSIVNAENSLNSAIVSRDRQQLAYEKSLADLKEAEETVAKPFDSYTYDNAINNAKLSLERKQSELLDAEADLKKAIENFDDYSYQNAITEAKATLDKRVTDLKEAEDKLKTETSAFDEYTYKNAINDAKTNLDRAKADLEKAEYDRNNGSSYFNSSSYDIAISSAQVEVNRKQKDYDDTLSANGNDTTVPAVIAAKRELEDAQTALNKAYNDLSRAQSDYYSSSSSTQDTANTKVTSAKNAVDDAQSAYDKAVKDLDRAKKTAVEDAQKSVTTAKTAVSDAQRAYNNAVTDLDRAKKDAVETTTDKVETAQNTVDDAQIAYDTAVADLQKAKDKAVDDNDKQLATAKRNVADAAKSLESAKLSVTNAQNSLNQAKNNGLTGESNVTNQQIALDKLLDQLAKAEIVASENGTVTTINAKEGTNPNGILFTLEDTNLLYVSAKIKEYNLKDLSIGQNVFIVTDATGNEIFDGDIIYISPKAVSEAGSTNVEFEIWVAIKNPNENIKIGMNAFLEIVITSKNDVYAVPLTAIITNENGTFIRSQSGNETLDIPVEVGIKTSTSAEISGEGIIEGLVILSDPNATPAPKQSILGF